MTIPLCPFCGEPNPLVRFIGGGVAARINCDFCKREAIVRTENLKSTLNQSNYPDQLNQSKQSKGDLK